MPDQNIRRRQQPQAISSNNSKNTTEPIKCSRQHTTYRQTQHSFTHSRTQFQQDNCTMPRGTVGAPLLHVQTGGVVDRVRCSDWQSTSEWQREWESVCVMTAASQHFVLFMAQASCRLLAPPRRPCYQMSTANKHSRHSRVSLVPQWL